MFAHSVESLMSKKLNNCNWGIAFAMYCTFTTLNYYYLIIMNK